MSDTPFWNPPPLGSHHPVPPPPPIPPNGGYLGSDFVPLPDDPPPTGKRKLRKWTDRQAQRLANERRTP